MSARLLATQSKVPVSNEQYRAQLNATLQEICDHFEVPEVTTYAYRTGDDGDDEIHFVGTRNEKRPFMMFVLFGQSIASISRPFYERLPRLLQSFADRWLTSNKRD